jgi:hypothetical protein
MHASLKNVLTNLSGLIQQTRQDMTAISNDPAAKAYGALYVKGQQLKKLTDAQKAGQATLGGFLADHWPLIQELRKTQAAGILTTLRDGPRVTWRTDFSEDEWRALGLISTEARRVFLQGERMRGQILQQLADDHQLRAEEHGLAMHGMRSTEELRSLIDGYREAAKGDLAGFDYAAWRADRAVLPLLLATRAAGGKDDRAGMLMESHFVAEIEASIVAQTVEPDNDSIFFLERTEDALAGMIATDGGQPVENLKAAEDWFAAVERRLAREDGTAPSTGPAPAEPAEPAPPAKPASTPVTAPVGGLLPGTYAIENV